MSAKLKKFKNTGKCILRVNLDIDGLRYDTIEFLPARTTEIPAKFEKTFLESVGAKYFIESGDLKEVK